MPADVEVTPEQRIAEARPLLPRPFAAVTGWAALRWLGSAWLDGSGRRPDEELDVQLVTGGLHARPQQGFAISEERLSWTDLIDVDGLRITRPVRSVCFLMRYAAGVREAVRALDLAAYNDLVSIAEVRKYADGLGGWTGMPQLRAALELADENAWSPREVDLRLIWELDAGLPRPLCNVPIFDLRGNLIGAPDVLDLEAGVVGEYDGALHLEGAQRTRDVRREALFRGHGLEYVTMLSSDLPDPSGVVGRILAAHRRASRHDKGERTWTVQPPAWWTPTLTVDQRRALTTSQRERFLSIRRRAA
ncbi:hypothetical protein [Nocardioides cavernaquae]|uniref:hypothetical protein n=1 Tax=Nocardioides cavernaquae TaxID=2321396 RepID=UPI0011C3ACE1|nr:hypothetical protein [Nocardioides cavernaquae]